MVAVVSLYFVFFKSYLGYSTQPWLSQFQKVIVNIEGMWKTVIRW